MNSILDNNLYIVNYGEEYCKPQHSYGPAIREYYLIHFVISGKGAFQYKDTVKHLSKGECFLIRPHDLTYYIADEKDPWHYMWIGIKGDHAESYIKDIFESDTRKFDNIAIFPLLTSLLMCKSGKKDLIEAHGIMYQIISNLYSNQDHTNIQYTEIAIDFIERSYMESITVSDIAKYLSLNRTYFSKLFKSKTGETPQNYLITTRLNAAKAMIQKQSQLSIGTIGRSVGYEDQFTFSKVFKKRFGISPQNYKNKLFE